MNQFTFSGNVGKEPTITSNDDPKKTRANFSVAVKTSFKKEDEPVWVNVTVFGATAGYVEKYINKGSKVYVTGTLSTFTSKDGGTQLSVTANSVESASSNSHEGGGNASTGGSMAPKTNVIDDSNDIPF